MGSMSSYIKMESTSYPSTGTETQKENRSRKDNRLRRYPRFNFIVI